MSEDALAAAMSALAQFQVTESSVGDTLQKIAEIAQEALPAATFAGMTMLAQDGQPTTAVFTDAESPEIDEAQYAEGKGPCLDAWRTRRVIRLDVMEDWMDAYPSFVTRCQERGVESTLSLPLMAGSDAIGALNLYAKGPSSFTVDDESLGMSLASVAGTVLANVSAYWTAFDLSENLTEAMRTRAVIEQAKGMLMSREPHPSADQAFEMLKHASQRENIKLRDIAQRLVDRTPPPEH